MSESVVVPFNFESHEVRTLTIDDEPWFVAQDVCKVLELKNPSVALQVLDEDEKGLSKVYTLGGSQQVSVINESGLYTLIVRSNKPQAKVFRKWVTSEVLPAIRKTGQYVAPQQPKHGQLALVLEDYQAAVAMAKMVGLDGNQAFLAADKMMRNMTGVSPLAQLEILHLVNETQERDLTPTQIASFDEIKVIAKAVLKIKPDNPVSAQHVNTLLELAGFQTSRYFDKQKAWFPTEDRKPLSTLVDTNKRYGCGTTVQQLKWKESVVREIVKYFSSNGK